MIDLFRPSTAIFSELRLSFYFLPGRTFLYHSWHLFFCSAVDDLRITPMNVRDLWFFAPSNGGLKHNFHTQYSEESSVRDLP